jgi:hypothetical protein
MHAVLFLTQTLRQPDQGPQPPKCHGMLLSLLTPEVPQYLHFQLVLVVELGVCCQVPTDYFVLVLGPHLKYSSCLYNSARNTLAEAEHNMLGGCCGAGQATSVCSRDICACVWLQDTL